MYTDLTKQISTYFKMIRLFSTSSKIRDFLLHLIGWAFLLVFTRSLVAFISAAQMI